MGESPTTARPPVIDPRPHQRVRALGILLACYGLPLLGYALVARHYLARRTETAIHLIRDPATTVASLRVLHDLEVERAAIGVLLLVVPAVHLASLAWRTRQARQWPPDLRSVLFQSRLRSAPGQVHAIVAVLTVSALVVAAAGAWDLGRALRGGGAGTVSAAVPAPASPEGPPTAAR